MCIIYCITNALNGKKYVGWTSKTLEERWKAHVKNAIVRKRKFLLSEAIRKYGAGDDVWKREVLYEVDSPEEAKLYEVRLIGELKSCPYTDGEGYNMTLGGDGGTMSGKANPFYGHHHTRETIEKMRTTLGDKLSGKNNPQFGLRGELSPCWGRKFSDETKKKISQGNRGKKRTEQQRRNMREGRRLARQKQNEREITHEDLRKS